MHKKYYRFLIVLFFGCSLNAGVSFAPDDNAAVCDMPENLSGAEIAVWEAMERMGMEDDFEYFKGIAEAHEITEREKLQECLPLTKQFEALKKKLARNKECVAAELKGLQPHKDAYAITRLLLVSFCHVAPEYVTVPGGDDQDLIEELTNIKQAANAINALG